MTLECGPMWTHNPHIKTLQTIPIFNSHPMPMCVLVVPNVILLFILDGERRGEKQSCGSQSCSEAQGAARQCSAESVPSHSNSNSPAWRSACERGVGDHQSGGPRCRKGYGQPQKPLSQTHDLAVHWRVFGA